MTPKPDMLLEVFRQTAFISAVVGGFIFGFVAVFLTSSCRKRIVGWTAVLAIASAVGFLICVLGWTMGIPRLQILVSEQPNEILNTLFKPLTELHRLLSLVFIASMFLFIVSLGISGWVRSKTVGIASCTLAGIAFVFFAHILRIFVH
jgi:hypothetical protein